MKVYRYTGDREVETPHPEDLRQWAEEDVEKLVTRVLAWKGSATVAYFERFHDVGPADVKSVLSRMEARGEIEVQDRPDDVHL